MPAEPTPFLWTLLFFLGPGLCFLVGSIPFGFLMGKAKGLDIRDHGSGNIGATNVWRVLGSGWGLAAFVLDFCKGFIPVLLIGLLVEPWPGGEVLNLLFILCGIAAILGHNYSPWLGFKGGKGIATSAGALAAVIPWACAVVVTIWVGMVLLTRIVSLSSIVASVALPVAVHFFYPGSWALLAFGLIAGALGVYRHKSNIGRLRRGEEPRIGQKPVASAAGEADHE
ncbi:MAG: glycerol-3-phosphate 1-O-acyltransferase PlsY [Verrucomicrobiota bacterium]